MKTGIVLVLGGARSGKSAYGEKLATGSGLEPVYIATATAGDAEMTARIAQHRARRGLEWRTIEEPHALEAALVENAAEGRALLVDCLTLWLTNLMLSGVDPETRGDALCHTARGLSGLVVFVSNEVGLGIVPDTALGRRFRDAQGRLNQAIAAVAVNVVFVAAGLPLFLKGAP